MVRRTNPGRIGTGRVATGAVVATLAVLLTAGCGGPGAGGGQLPTADDPAAWAGRLCASLQPLGALKGPWPKLDPNNPAAGRDALINYFSSAEDAAGQALEGLKQAGPSPIAGGDDAATKVHGALLRLQAAYHDAKVKLDAVDPNDPVGLGTQLPGIFQALAAASNDKDLDAVGTNQALNDAVKQAPSCRLVPAATN